MAQNSSFQLPELSIRQIVMGTLVVVLIGFLFWLLFRFYQVVFILFVAVIISIAMRPVVEWLHRRGIPRPLGIILVYFLLLALLATFVVVGIPLIGSQIANMVNTLPEAYSQLHEAMLASRNFLLWRLALQLPPELPALTPPEPVNNETVSPFVQTWRLASLVGGTVFAVVAVLILAFYWTLDGERAKRSLYMLVPRDKRDGARDLVANSELKVGNYIGGQILLCGIIGSLALVTYLLVGLPYALVLAIFAGLMEAIPIIGPAIGALPAVVVAYSIDPVRAVWVVVATIVIQQLENVLLVPRIMDKAVGVHPLVTLLAFIALSTFFGIAGAIVAIPLAAVLQLVFDRYLLAPGLLEQKTPTGRDQLSVLRYETQELVRDVRKQVRNKEAVASADSDQIEDSLEAIAMDLDSLLAQPNSSEVSP